jgi:hypothetical protein
VSETNAANVRLIVLFRALTQPMIYTNGYAPNTLRTAVIAQVVAGLLPERQTTTSIPAGVKRAGMK